MRRALQAMRETGPNAREPYYLALLGEALTAQGALREAHTAFDDALDHIARGGMRHWAEPEVHRLRAELFLTGPDPRAGEAQAHLARAVAIAEEQGALLLGLRAGMSLCRLLRDLDRHDDAIRALADVLGRVGEADAPEITQARNLLGGRG